MDMWTKRALIVKAFEELTLGEAFDLAPAELQSALHLLDTMMAEWLSCGVSIGYTVPDGPTSNLDDDSGIATKHARRVWLSLAVILGAQFGKPVAKITIKGARRGYEELLISAAYAATQEPAPEPIAYTMTADFGVVGPWPALKSRLGFAQNLKTLGAGLEGTMPYLVELGACGFSGACEFDLWHKDPGAVNPCMDATYDGFGRAVTMTDTPTATATNWASMLNTASIKCGIQLIGAIPEQQIATTYEPRRHPPPVNMALHCDKVSNWIRSTKWPCPIDWSLWNEPLRTQLDCKKGKGLLNEVIAETDAEYELRRQGLKEQAVISLRDLYLGTFSTAGTKTIGKWSTANVGSLLSGDTKTSNGRSMVDGRTGRAGWWDEYDLSIAGASQVTQCTYATHNDFANRAAIRGDVNDFNGKDYPLWYTQGGPSLLKASNDDDGGDDQDPAADTRMGPACEMLTMLLAESERPEVALRCFSYWMGGVDGFVSYVSPGVYTLRHRYTAAKMWTRIPARRVPMTYVAQNPEGDKDLFGQQGLLGVAGIDPNANTAAVLFWSELSEAYRITPEALNLPPKLTGLTPTYVVLSESAPLGEVVAFNGAVTVQPRTAHLLIWSVGTSPETRRNPLQDGTRTPVFIARRDVYNRPKAAAGYFDQVRGVCWITPSLSYTSTIGPAYTWKNAPDKIWANLWLHNLDAPSAPVVISCDYGAGDVVLLNTLAGSIAQGQIVELDILGNAPAGWDVGDRLATIAVSMAGACMQRLECWLSGTQEKAADLFGS
jgi:hypothetical protein